MVIGAEAALSLLLASSMGKARSTTEDVPASQFSSDCLLFSSFTIHSAVRSLRRGNVGFFLLLWVLTAALAATFLVGTFREWHRLIYEEGLTIQTNLFGTTYYSLVGLHAFHVTAGFIALLTVSLFGLLGHVRQEHAERVDVLSLYWHFVDGVWGRFTVVCHRAIEGRENGRRMIQKTQKCGRDRMPASTSRRLRLACAIPSGLVTAISAAGRSFYLPPDGLRSHETYGRCVFQNANR
jgi:heme/copper-type cytochrome/quinol oxidase subunit 3